MGLSGRSLGYQNLQAQKRGLKAGTQIQRRGHSLASGVIRGKTSQALRVWTQASWEKELPVNAGTSKEGQMRFFSSAGRNRKLEATATTKMRRPAGREEAAGPSPSPAMQNLKECEKQKQDLLNAEPASQSRVRRVASRCMSSTRVPHSSSTPSQWLGFRGKLCRSVCFSSGKLIYITERWSDRQHLPFQSFLGTF